MAYFSSKSDEWTCQRCTFINQGMRRKCEMCFAKREPGDIGRNLSYHPTIPQDNPIAKDNWKGTGVENEIRVVLIGKTGSGKSATGNTFLGRDVFASEASGVSLTQKCSYKTAKRFGKTLMVVDTPGLFDTGMSNEQVTKEIVKCVGISAPGPHAFVMVVSVGRFTKEEQETVRCFGDIFGEEMYNHMIVLFTRRDDIERQNIDVHEYVQKKAPKELQSLVQKCNRQVLAINNVQGRDMRDKDAETFITMVNEITTKNGGSCYSNEMYEEAEKQLRIRIEEVKRQKEIEKENEKMQIKREMDVEYQDKIANIERQKQEAERKGREQQEKVRKLEQKRATDEMQARSERSRLEREQEKMKMEHDEMKRRIQESEQRELSLKRQMERERENADRQRKEELEYAFQKKMEIMERQNQESAKKERELQEKARELEQQKAQQELREQTERLRIEKEQERMNKEYDERKRRIQEVEEREAAIRREKIEKEERALKELERKHRVIEGEIREGARKEIEKEDKGFFSTIAGGIKKVFNGIKSFFGF